MNISGKTPGKTDTPEPLNPLKGLLELKQPNQLAKLQLSLREERPPSSADPIGRREDPQPARLRSIRLDKAKMNVEVTPTATRKPTIAPFTDLSQGSHAASHNMTQCSHDWSPSVARPFIGRSRCMWNFCRNEALWPLRKGLP